ncbi:hypothetical protein RRG08_047217 [Elysia crispata]|uniref:Uncharacterized protein n=1 Tax=Elysia crispata TaxID=231223 RepID=A0AAE1B9S9_9GAST|nr:hypothetical protein RRG08_047217 [Elysia crispata]
MTSKYSHEIPPASQMIQTCLTYALYIKQPNSPLRSLSKPPKTSPTPCFTMKPFSPTRCECRFHQYGCSVPVSQGLVLLQRHSAEIRSCVSNDWVRFSPSDPFSPTCIKAL